MVFGMYLNFIAMCMCVLGFSVQCASDRGIEKTEKMVESRVPFTVRIVLVCESMKGLYGTISQNSVRYHQPSVESYLQY